MKAQLLNYDLRQRRLMMKKKQYFMILFAGLLSIFLFLGSAQASWLDKARTVELKGKLQTRASISTEDTEGFTFPEVDSGELVQHRNLAYIEFNHALKDANLDGNALSYHLLGRFLYEGVYDYGADEYQDVRESMPDEIDEFKKDADLWEAYVDITRGPLFFRIGRQNLAWGETDLFRLLDNINPLDNTYGGIFEDLDDRRIPLDMLRVTYDVGNVGPVSSFTLEGYWAPGILEDTVAPMSPYGTRYAAPLPLFSDLLGPTFTSYGQTVITPEKEMHESRYGVRHTGVLLDNLNYSLAFMRTIPDNPAARIVADFTPVGPQFTSLNQELFYDTQDIFGASVNFYQTQLDTVFRAELAYFPDEPVFIVNENAAPVVDLMLFGAGGPFPTRTVGTIPERNVTRYMEGMDKWQFIPVLNKNSTFYFTFQYFGQYIDDHSEEIVYPVSLPPDGTTYPEVKKLEQTFTGVISSTYGHGMVEPQLSVVYDVRGTWMVQPQVNIKFDPWRLMLQYTNISGKRTAFGHFKDRDQATVVLSYLF
jgi:hypothetical protein